MRLILFLERNKLSAYGGKLDGIVSLEFDPKVASDIEVLDKEALKKSLDDFIEKNKIAPMDSLIVLSPNTYFQTEIEAKSQADTNKKEKPKSPQPPQTSETSSTTQAETDIEEAATKPEEASSSPPVDVPSKTQLEEESKEPLSPEDEKEEFLSYVPFQSIFLKEYSENKKKKLVAANADFIQTFCVLLEKHLHIEAVVPLAALPSTKDDALFNPELAGTLMKQYSSLLQAQISTELPEKKEMAPEFEFADAKPKNNLRLLVGIFVFLGLVLALVFVWRWRQNQTQEAKKSVAPTLIPTRTAAVVNDTEATQSAEATSEAAIDPTINKKTYTIEILNGSGIAGQADTISQALKEQEYVNISTGNADQTRTESEVIFKELPSLKIQEEIRDIVFEETGTAKVRTDNTIEADLLIITARPPVSPTQEATRSAN